MAKTTVASLTADIATAKAELTKARQAYNDERDARLVAEQRQKQTAKEFDDLKTRLHSSEMENQRLRGYVQRVQEDDVVREDMITVGDPEGERHLVPKRKPTHFERANDMTDFSDRIENGYGYSGDRQRKTKHWITY